MTQSADKIHDAVRQHYGERIRAEGRCCGGDSGGQGNADFYPADLLSTLPEGELPPSFGCGDPVTLASLQAGQVVLDLGSGAGLDCFFASRKVGPAGRVIGIDMTPEMIERARETAARLGLRNVEFRPGYLEALPVEDAEVDVVISNCVINLAPEKGIVFREVFRVLKPGGSLAVSDIVSDGPLPENVKTSLGAWAGCIAGALDVADYRRSIESAGFTAIQITPAYFEEAAINEAITTIKESVDIEAMSREELTKAVFSARITARKP